MQNASNLLLAFFMVNLSLCLSQIQIEREKVIKKPHLNKGEVSKMLKIKKKKTLLILAELL
ncbi:hypothetical protein CYR83_04200 [Ligilactobacillus agilis]|nr:hypothetical protein CYR83_04200 [Ligilactobacillus agilis]